jgi:hypothetical protein
MEHLIANSGIQFIVKEVEFNSSEPIVFAGGKSLKYYFVDQTDPFTFSRIFDLLTYHEDSDVYIPLGELSDNNFEQLPDGRVYYDEAGMPRLRLAQSVINYSNYKDGSPDIFYINSLESYRVHDPNGGRAIFPAFQLLLNKWLPMPMFECEFNGYSSAVPYAWCRVKIEEIGVGSKANLKRYRFTWAFDTELAKDFLSISRPYFGEDEKEMRFSLCNKASNLLGFMSTDEKVFSSFSDYIAALLGLNEQEKSDSYKYIGFYIYLINYIRLAGASPEVTLHNAEQDTIPVDMVLDIGNSRTCGVLFEDSDFTKSMMLELRDISNPHLTYGNPFDMRLVFRKADFGHDIVMEEDMFSWKSLVRVGEEAKKLVYRSLEDEGLKARTTNYSSPKRYLWDDKQFDGKWEFLTTTDDPSNVQLSDNIYIPILSDLFDAKGEYIGNKNLSEIEYTDGKTNYSRSSLMTFVLIEIFQQAIIFINSPKFREKHGDVNCKRVMRNVILTCPTAMPHNEQIRLRKYAQDAYEAITRCSELPHITITPSVESLKVVDKYADVAKRTWSFDEASCSQLVYLYAEINEKYHGEIDKFFDIKGHVIPKLAEEGYNQKAITIGTIDIGAGTTDVMICAYERDGKIKNCIKPIPLWWDSFYLAGDDIMRSVIQNVIIEGNDLGRTDMGNITSVLTARLINMDDFELMAHPCANGNPVYARKIEDIVREVNEERKRNLKRVLASNLIHDFFGQDSAMNSYKDRRCRIDFNTQISYPMAQMFLDMLRVHRPSGVYSYKEIFSSMEPASYLLDYFANHFGFRFEELMWRYDAYELAAIVKSAAEPLLKQLAEVFYVHNCDVLVLAGRPTSLDAITELFVKYIPVSPHRQVRLNDYRVGQWFPFADGQGYFYDQKAVVAVGAMVGHLASNAGFNGLSIDFTHMIERMESTANYMGIYNSRRQQVEESFLTPNDSSTVVHIQGFPVFIGCKKLNSVQYQARPMFAIYNHSNSQALTLVLSRNYTEDKEKIFIEEITDSHGNNVPKRDVELIQQSIVNDGKYWLDKGEFELAIK